MILEKTWRWFGENDPITLAELKQMDVEGVVTALHHIPNGEVWPKEEIQKLKTKIESYGMTWSVVESLPVSEGIKIASADRPRLISNYQESLKNLGACGIPTVCYNFMPVLDWTRTDIDFSHPNGTESMYFDMVRFVAFDVFILKRPGAETDYPSKLLRQAKTSYDNMSQKDIEELIHNIIATQQFVDGLVHDSDEDPLKIFLNYIKTYQSITKEKLRENLKSFLEAVVPIAEQAGVNLAIHPDDPPFSLLGLPRIMSCKEDYEWLLQAHPSITNGVTFCTGSLSARKDNQLQDILQLTLDRIHFVHLRNTKLLEDRSFYESGHLVGSQDMGRLILPLLKEQYNRKSSGLKHYRIPFRSDHGLTMLTDFDKNYHPGYPLIGRLRGLAELEGLMQGLNHHLKYNP